MLFDKALSCLFFVFISGFFFNIYLFIVIFDACIRRWIIARGGPLFNLQHDGIRGFPFVTPLFYGFIFFLLVFFFSCGLDIRWIFNNKIQSGKNVLVKNIFDLFPVVSY